MMTKLSRHNTIRGVKCQIRDDGGIEVEKFLANRTVINEWKIDWKRFHNIIRTEKEDGKMRFELYLYEGASQQCSGEPHRGTPYHGCWTLKLGPS